LSCSIYINGVLDLELQICRCYIYIVIVVSLLPLPIVYIKPTLFVALISHFFSTLNKLSMDRFGPKPLGFQVPGYSVSG
jgi:hypothetical protein